MTQDNYGNVLGILGQRQGETEMLKKAVAAFEGALEERTQERVPMDWVATQNNLGAALQTLGSRQEASHAQYMELGEEQRKRAQALVTALGE